MKMGIIKRMTNIFRAKANKIMNELEGPIELLDQKIIDMEDNLRDSVVSTAQVLGNIHEMKTKMDETKKEIEDLENKITFALSKNNEELARKVLQKKMELDTKYENLKKNYEEAKERGETLKSSLEKLEKELERTKSYRDEAKARMYNTTISSAINEIISDVSSKVNKINIDEIERKIQKKEAYSKGLEELKGKSIDEEFEELNKLDLNSELEKYKNKQ